LGRLDRSRLRGNARECDVGFQGSVGRLIHVRFTTGSRHWATPLRCPLYAITRLMHCNMIGETLGVLDDLHRLRRLNITKTGRARVSISSAGLARPVGFHWHPYRPRPNRHRARRTVTRIPFPQFPPLEVFERRPPAADFATQSVIGRHPKTFTLPDITAVRLMHGSVREV
jgi:hypothetical protein